MYIAIFVVLLSFLIGWLGRYRRFGFWGYFFASILFTPFLGALLLVASGPFSPDPER